MTIGNDARFLVAGAALALLWPPPAAAEEGAGRAGAGQPRTVTFTQIESAPGQPDETSRFYVSGPNLLRTETDDGYVITDAASRKAMIVRHRERRVQILEGLARIGDEPRDFYAAVRELPTESAAPPERQIDGARAVGFVARSGGTVRTVWADPETRLPVRIEETSGRGDRARTVLQTGFVFDRPLDDALFRMVPPEGYAVETFGVPAIAPEFEDQDLAAPLVTPLVGIGAARFGMTRDQVVGALGPPEREFRQGKVLFLSYYSRGFELMVLPPDGPRPGLYQISCLGQHGFAVKVREFRGWTDKGIGLGDGRDDIIQAYGPPSAEDSEAPTGQSSLRYEDLRLDFALNRGKIYRITLMAPRPAPARKP